MENPLPEEVIGRVWPDLLRANESASRADREVVVQIALLDRFASAWTYVFSPAGLHVHRGMASASDLCLGIFSKDVTALAEGGLDVARAAGDGRIQVRGQTKLLLWLARRFASPNEA